MLTYNTAIAILSNKAALVGESSDDNLRLAENYTSDPDYQQQLDCHIAGMMRIGYPRYLANDWQIGSAPVERACKMVVGNRLKGGGMRDEMARKTRKCTKKLSPL